ncbi:MAD2L1-binding protein-like [Synchiropus splendidus]|uniref:MAD2L1-binding protein-like n=1 Tax=Synchiropus splendidus TaxID=270530 RepID=UPI00237D6C66|nr:MAD2L1-binding protein-like [Synchiropus splendidus]
MVKKRLSFSSENAKNAPKEGKATCKGDMLEMCLDDSSLCIAEVDGPTTPSRVDTKDLEPDFHEKQPTGDQSCVNKNEEKEHTKPSEDLRTESCSCDHDLATSEQHNTMSSDVDVARRAQEEGLVKVVFPGQVTAEGSCRFVTDLIKLILYHRQQLPMTYEQLMHDQKKSQEGIQDKDRVGNKSVKPADIDRRRQQKVLQDLEELMQQLEVLFSLSRVPRVLLLLGGSVVLPTEMYEINMEGLSLASGDHCLRVSACLRKLFRTIFVADFLLDAKPVRLMSTTVLVLAHRDCGVEWFRPKLQFKVPTRVKNKVIALSTNDGSEDQEWDDYVWFQVPVPIKGIGH